MLGGGGDGGNEGRGEGISNRVFDGALISFVDFA